ncbi:hypothetical protein BKE38_03585 [Pseudoroseomonas deserti]|uniref:Uncharacterized protein n=2 Tax=Teichococcus deserti TaxID=1817963 RepID=A0A1V2H931_9PROT|nr:hypothetical protein BKE38_03585 [Pseudoroseomonas deserti]
MLPAERLAELEGLATRLQDGVAGLRAALEAQTVRATSLERELAVTEAKLLVETMHSAGLAAQATHLLAVGPEAALAEAEDHAGQTMLSVVYEQAFDAKGRELGVEDPARFRVG